MSLAASIIVQLKEVRRCTVVRLVSSDTVLSFVSIQRMLEIAGEHYNEGSGASSLLLNFAFATSLIMDLITKSIVKCFRTDDFVRTVFYHVVRWLREVT